MSPVKLVRVSHKEKKKIKQIGGLREKENKINFSRKS